MTKAVIELSAVDKTRAAFDSAKANLQGLGQQVSGLPGKFGTLGVAIAGALSAASVKGSIDVLDRLDDLSEKSGISVESLSALRYAGEVTGTSLESLATGVSKLSRNMADAVGGGKETSATFKALNIELKNADGSLRSQDLVLGDLADRFKSFPDGPEKSALAIRVFGKSGEDMIPLLNQGSDGIARLKKEAEGLGAVYGGDLAKAAAEFNDNLKKLELNAEAAKVSLAGGLLPELNRIIEAFIRLKSAGQVWTVMKDAAKDMVGMGRMTDNPGADINQLMADRTRKQADLAFAKKRGFATRDLEDDLRQTEDLLDASRVRQAGRALRDAGDSSDAMSRRMGRGRGKSAAPVVAGGDGVGAKTADRELKEQAKLLLELNGLSGSFTEDWERLTAIYAKGGINLKQLTAAQAELLSKQPAIKAMAEEEKQRNDDLEKGIERNKKIRKEYVDGLYNENEQRNKAIKTLTEEIEEIGLSGEALAKVRLARMDANIAREEELALQARARVGNEEEADLLDERVRLMKEERELRGSAATKETEAIEKEANKRRTDDLTESIADGILAGTRKGKSFWDVLTDEVTAQWSKTILQPTIRPFVEAGNQLITGAMNGITGGKGFNDILGSIGNMSFGGSGAFVPDAGMASYAGEFAKLIGLSFDGGGYTGNGQRSGGLDGKGGFMAMMHPQETVVDHTKGQSMGGVTYVTNNYQYGHNVSRGDVLAATQQARLGARDDRIQDQRRRRS